MNINIKDIAQLKASLCAQGYRNSDIEAIVISVEDYCVLRNEVENDIHHMCNSIGHSRNNSFSVLGVSIIVSDYLPQGKMLRVLKEDAIPDKRFVDHTMFTSCEPDQLPWAPPPKKPKPKKQPTKKRRIQL